MKTLSALLVLCLGACLSAGATDCAAVLRLRGDLLLCYAEMVPTRDLPQVYVRQALESLRAGGATVLLSRENGLHGADADIEYSMVAFTKASDAPSVRVAGAVRSSATNRVFLYSADVPRADWSRSVETIVQAVSTLPQRSRE